MRPVQFINVSLESLRKEGPDALAVLDIPNLRKAELQQLTTEYDDDTHCISITEAEDVFHCPALIPKNARFISARLRLHFANTTRTVTVEIRPPDTILIDPDSMLPLLAPWLLQHHFTSHIKNN